MNHNLFMKRIILLLIILFSLSISAQNQRNKNIDIIGCWTKSIVPHQNRNLNVYGNCNTSSGSLNIDFRKSGVYRLYSANLNSPQRCGNYIVKKTNQWGKYEYKREEQTIDIYTYGGKYEFTWQLHEMDNGQIGFKKI
ncbi:hypothetical protein SAMN04488007_3513 [Maribacter aquivivus]|uniref:Lipocalin-like domain-containing protein n=2 Tax=Maribacter aquivivus TaxID=228958 RepID=A0A1M6U6Z8_9FLAO|nr:hypothetical protein SAMN04488007_3513 [Maribacter aquivivus]